MNKTFKTLFTLFLGILFFIPTFTANSAEKETGKVICINESPNNKNLFIYKKINSDNCENSNWISKRKNPIQYLRLANAITVFGKKTERLVERDRVLSMVKGTSVYDNLIGKTQQVVKKEPTQTPQVTEKKKKETKLSKSFKKTKLPKIFKKKEKKEVIKIEDIYALGTPIKIEDLPEGMIKVFGKSCTKFLCRTNKATKIMSRSFSRGENYNGRHPDNMIKAMAYFELFYMGQLRKNRYELAKYNKYQDKKKQMSGFKALSFKETENKMRSLIGTNKGRKAMREALGMTIELDPATAIKRFWALGELLALGEPKEIEISKDMKERAEIMKRYAAILGKMQKKLEEEKEEREKKETKE